MAIRFVNPSGSNTSPYDTEVKAATVIQTALTGASSSDIIAVRDDADYVLSSTLSIPNVEMLAIVGYRTNAPTVKLFDGDMSIGGAFYKAARVTIDNDNVAQSAITYLANTQLMLLNIQLTNNPTTHPAIDWVTNGTAAVSGVSVLINNCELTGGANINCQIVNNMVLSDSLITGTWEIAGGKTYFPCFRLITGGLITGNFFKIDAGEGYLTTSSNASLEQDSGAAVYGNIFTLGGSIDKEMIRARHGGSFFNNVFYQPIGTLMGEGQGSNAMLLNSNESTYYETVFNNIFFSAETGINRAEGIHIETPLVLGYNLNFNCLFNTDNSNYTLGDQDIETDPLFVNPQADDFRLKSSSPCIATGQPAIVGNGIFNSSNMGTDTGILTTVNANIVSIIGNTSAASNIKSTYDGTGYSNGVAPATQADLEIVNVRSQVIRGDTAAIYAIESEVDASNTVTTFTIDDGSSNDNAYKDMYITVTNNIDSTRETRRIASYTGASRTVVVDTAFTFIPANSDFAKISAIAYSAGSTIPPGLR